MMKHLSVHSLAFLASSALSTLALLPVGALAQTSPIRVLDPISRWNIRATVEGPTTVQIDWMPLSGADEYRLYRNGAALGPVYPSAPNATQPITVYDYAAPSGSTVAYYVTASHKTTVVGLPNTPGAGASVTTETLLQTSNTVSVVTPAPTLTLNWTSVIDALHAGRFGVRRPLSGFVDLHTHPLSYLGFGGKLIFGAVDALAPLPPTRWLFGNCWPSSGVPSEMTAMGPPFENIVYGAGPPVDPSNPCGDTLRFAVIQALPLALGSAYYPPPTWYISGPPSFITWPAWNDVLHQKMWVDWLRRSYAGGLRVMVALAVNNQLLGNITAGPADLPTDDLSSADLQIAEIKNFVARHSDFMQVVSSSTELYNAVSGSPSKLAVVIGVEIDHIGNLTGNVSPTAITAEIDRLYNEGVRYIFPVHLVDNPIGASAAYSDLFNVANVYENGTAMNLSCEQGIGYRYAPPSPALMVAAAAKLGASTPGIPPSVPCLPGYGNVNVGIPNGFRGLTAAGKVAIQHMMDLSMLIDVDHMSELAVTDTILLAKQNTPIGYPLMSGHNNLRGTGDPNTPASERQLTAWQYAEIGKLHGMAGIGSAKADAALWLSTYQATLAAMVSGSVAAGGFGTDADGMEFMMPPRQNSSVNPAAPPAPIPPLPPAEDGLKTWDYNRDGVAHYGLLPDFLMDVGSLPGGTAAVQRMFGGAQYFYETWFIAEQDKKM
jgi:hypothetical protein